jgi:hypothetical protein
MNKNRWWGVKLVALCALASLLGLAATGDAHGAYTDCTMCHLNPAPDSRAKDYFNYFAMPERHHPTGIAYPAARNQDYFRPTSLVDNISFFDENGNGVADLGEVQLFGIGGKIECASCHREHDGASPPAHPNMYLRLTTELLCMVCHRL